MQMFTGGVDSHSLAWEKLNSKSLMGKSYIQLLDTFT